MYILLQRYTRKLGYTLLKTSGVAYFYLYKGVKIHLGSLLTGSRNQTVEMSSVDDISTLTFVDFCQGHSFHAPLLVTAG